jgi:Flp pilus assembly pilin Flp
MKSILTRFWRETDGQDLVEYALIVAAIALGMIAAVKGVTNALNSLYQSISTALGTVGTPGA